MITVRNIKKSYGSGKSTLLNSIGGLEKVDEGEVIIDGISINGLKKEDLRKFRRDKLGFVFQFYNLLPNLCVRDI